MGRSRVTALHLAYDLNVEISSALRVLPVHRIHRITHSSSLDLGLAGSLSFPLSLAMAAARSRQPRGDGSSVAPVDARGLAFDHAKASASIPASSSSHLSALSSPSSSLLSVWSAQQPTAPSSFSHSSPSHSSTDGGVGGSSSADASEGVEKLLDFSDVSLLPPRRSNHPAYQAPPRTQSTYAHSTPAKRPHDDSFPSSQPLPDTAYTEEAIEEQPQPAPPSPLIVGAADRSIVWESPLKDAAPTLPLARPSPVPVSIDLRNADEAAVSSPTEQQSASSSMEAAEASPAVTSPSSLLPHLLALSPHAYHLSQYHVLLGLTYVQMGQFASALSCFQQAEAFFHPALDVASPSALHSQRANLKALQARASAELAAQTRTANATTDSPDGEEDVRRLLLDAVRLYSEAIAQEEGGRPDLWNELALLLLRCGEMKAGMALYELLLSTYGDYPDLFVNLAVLKQAYGQPDVAIRYLQTALASHPSHIAALINYAAALSSQRMHEESIRVLNLALHYHPTDAVALNALAVEYDTVGDAVAALQCYDRARSFGEGDHGCGASLNLNIATHLVRQAREEVDDEVRIKELEGAEVLLRAELNREVSGHESAVAPLLHLTLGSVYAEKFNLTSESNELEHAEAEYVAALRLSPDDADAWNELGLLYSIQNDEVKAKAAFVRILDCLPPSFPSTPPLSAVPALNNLALLCTSQGCLEQAIQLLHLAAKPLSHLSAAEAKPSELSPPSPPTAAMTAPSDPALPLLLSVLVNLGRAHHLAHQLDQAQSAYERCLTLRPFYFSALNGLSAVHAARGEWEEAERRMEEAIQSHPDGRHSDDLRHNQQLLAERVSQHRGGAVLVNGAVKDLS